MKEPFTDAEISRARELRKSLPLTIVVERLGRHSYASWATTLSNEKSGKRKGVRAKRLRRQAYVEEAIRLGATTKELAHALHISMHSVGQMLRGMGLDRDERIRLRNEELIATGRPEITSIKNTPTIRAREIQTRKMLQTLRRGAYVKELVTMGVRPIELAELRVFKNKQRAAEFLKTIGLGSEKSRIAFQKQTNPRISEILETLRKHTQEHQKNPTKWFFTDEVCALIDEVKKISEISYKEIGPALGNTPGAVKTAQGRWRERQAQLH